MCDVLMTPFRSSARPLPRPVPRQCSGGDSLQADDRTAVVTEPEDLRHFRTHDARPDLYLGDTVRVMALTLDGSCGTKKSSGISAKII